MTIQKKARLWPADAVERWPIDDLLPYARNCRTNSDERSSNALRQTDGNRFCLFHERDHDRTLAVFDHRPNFIERTRQG